MDFITECFDIIISSDNLGNWDTSWSNPSDDIWATVTNTQPPEPPAKDWGYDDGWSGPTPDLNSQDKFPTLGHSAAPPKKSRAAFANKPKPRPTVVPENRSRGEPSQSGPSWIQNSVNQIKSPPRSQEPSDNLTNLVRKPAASFNNILINTPKHVTKKISSSSEEDFEIISQPSSLSKNKPVELVIPPIPILAEPVIPQRPKAAEPVSQHRPIPVKSTIPQRPKGPIGGPIGSRLDLLDPVAVVHSLPAKVPIYTQLVTQLKQFSSKGKPLVYIIQNGNITVSIAETIR